MPFRSRLQPFTSHYSIIPLSNFVLSHTTSGHPVMRWDNRRLIALNRSELNAMDQFQRRPSQSGGCLVLKCLNPHLRTFLALSALAQHIVLMGYGVAPDRQAKTMCNRESRSIRPLNP
jgi:hypothetical protein